MGDQYWNTFIYLSIQKKKKKNGKEKSNIGTKLLTSTFVTTDVVCTTRSVPLLCTFDYAKLAGVSAGIKVSTL